MLSEPTRRALEAAFLLCCLVAFAFILAASSGCATAEAKLPPPRAVRLPPRPTIITILPSPAPPPVPAPPAVDVAPAPPAVAMRHPNCTCGPNCDCVNCDGNCGVAPGTAYIKTGPNSWAIRQCENGVCRLVPVAPRSVLTRSTAIHAGTASGDCASGACGIKGKAAAVGGKLLSVGKAIIGRERRQERRANRRGQ